MNAGSASIAVGFEANTYGPAIAELLGEKRLMPLGPGSPNRAARGKLDALTVESAFAGRRVRDQEMARACLAGLWLYHDYLEESHSRSQSIDTPTGGYWHGVMHRREPDFSNAQYWFRRVGTHPVYGPLAMAARQIAAGAELPAAAVFLSRQSSWDPFGFVDLCAAVSAGRADCEMLCRQIQQREWEILFDYCYRQALED